MQFRIKFLGGASKVTGSCHLLTAGSKRILIDCGVEQGSELTEELNLPVDEPVDHCLLTHAHLDHCGLLPLLVKRKKLNGYVISTYPTKMIAEIILRDFMNIYRTNFGKLPFTDDDLSRLFSRWKVFDYYENIELSNLLKAKFYDAAHIIGSASVVFDYAGEYSILFTGDIGTANTRILKYPPKKPKSVGYLVMESTYGNMEHENNIDKAISFIKETLDNGGKVLIPSFSVGRTQEVIYTLNKANIVGSKKYPLYLDSPMAHKVTVLSYHLSPFLRPLKDLGGNLFNGYIPVVKMADSKKLAESKEPCVIVSASGMLTGGRVLNHYQTIKDDEKSAIVFVGYQANETLGRKIIDGEEQVKCRVFVAHGFSAHADRKELIDYVSSFEDKPFKVFITHGEEEQRKSLADLLNKHGIDAVLPLEGEEYTCDKQRPVKHSEITREEKESYGWEEIVPDEFEDWFLYSLKTGKVGIQKLDELINAKTTGINTALSWCKGVYSRGRFLPISGQYTKDEEKRIGREVYEMFCRAAVWLSPEALQKIKKTAADFKWLEK